MTYHASTDAGRAFAALADEFLARVELPGLLAAARPLIEQQAQRLIERVDADPGAARAGVLEIMRRLVCEFGLEPAELFVLPGQDEEREP